MKPNLLKRVCAVALLAAPVASMAHSPYLLPNAFDIVDRKHVTVEASFTETFFVPDVAMKSDDYHVLGPDGSRHALTPVYTKDLTILEALTPARGTYRITSGQRTGRTSKAAWVNGDWQFLEPGKAAPSGAQVYDMQSITRAEVYVTRGGPTQQVLAPAGSGLEFHALEHPNALFVGAEARFRVLFEGKPLPKHAIDVHFGDERYTNRKPYAHVVTDEQGQFAVRLEHAGIYLATTRHRVLPAKTGEPAKSHTYAVTFEATE